MRLSYRRATLSDAAALAEFSRATFVDTFGHLYPRWDIDPYLAEARSEAAECGHIDDPDTEILIAFDPEGAIAGYCHLGPQNLPFDNAGRAALELRRLYVREDQKGAGAAARMMDWAITRARMRGADDMLLGVHRDNARALAFYTKFGFTIVGRYDFSVGATRDDERIMRLEL